MVVDLLEFDAVTAAIAGVDDAYFCHPIAPSGLLTDTAMFTQAASEADVKAMVNISQISVHCDAKSKSVQQYWLTERLLGRCAFIAARDRAGLIAAVVQNPALHAKLARCLMRVHLRSIRPPRGAA
ncbi:hypothetical protein SAMN04488580_10666 [Mycobacterium sp. 283mftsu]|nr:hypothetical protein SAMN04488580_10666 [Mycobacterium sp. 283mftsu]